MQEAIFDNHIRIEYPDDFYVMSTEELNKYFAGDMQRLGVRNAAKHVILSIGKTNPSLANLVTDAKSVLSGAESAMRKNLNGYQCIERFDAPLLGKNAKGIRFEYVAKDEDVRQVGEMTVAKVGTRFYVTYCLARLATLQENADLFGAFRQSIATL